MKIIHTADWHLCDRLGRLNRTADLKARVERVAAYCDEHDVDVLIVAGDVFSEQASVDDMTDALTHIRTTFKGFFARGGTILAITGNHDRDTRINMVRVGMHLAVPDAGRDGMLTGGRMYLINGRSTAKITGANGDIVQFVLVPFPFASRYDVAADEYKTKEEEHRLLHAKVSEWIREVSTGSDIDVSLPTVMVAHLHVRGAEVHRLYKMDDSDDVLFSLADLNPTWAYVALGHIHKPQVLGGSANVQYPGSLDRLDFGETHDNHGVLLLEINGANAVVPTRLPIPPTPFHTITITNPAEELPTLAEKYLDHETAIVRVTATLLKDNISRDEVTRQLRKLFPRLHELKWVDNNTPDDSEAARTFKPRPGFATTIRDYLNEKLATDIDREALLALAESFLKDAGEA